MAKPEAKNPYYYCLLFRPAEISFLIVLFSFIVLLPSLWPEINFAFFDRFASLF